MPKITPNLWFDTRAEEAANLYVSIFPNSKIGTIARYSEAGAKAAGQPPGAVMTVTFELDGQPFMGLNGGPMFKFSEAVSFVVNCETQAEIDRYWEQLSSGGGQEGPCGWLKDRFGLSWQIVPTALGQLMKGPNAQQVMAALLKMKKLDIATLQQAAESA
ncbi:MAG TPA: VOC family protein [Thermoanaerobaculia bacterium]|jgi:predicted 3-demethylubiquinone-9 3-methyltransferase (glyoxalase superfamily)|nr:VOC family protein [Thermoanaerobaculia bacterium]